MKNPKQCVLGGWGVRKVEFVGALGARDKGVSKTGNDGPEGQSRQRWKREDQSQGIQNLSNWIWLPHTLRLSGIADESRFLTSVY